MMPWMDRLLCSFCVLFVLLFILLFNVGYGQDCTTDYNADLPRLEERSRTSPAATTNFISDDGIDEVCYNMGSYHMPIVPPEIGFCGTYYPAYMEGPLPTFENGTMTKKVCVKGFFSECSTSWDITVRTCEDHTVYCLISTDENSGYCFDPVELQTEDPINPAPDITIPAFSITIDINWKVVGNIRLPTFGFVCNFELPNTDTGTLKYWVQWFVDGNAILGVKSGTKDTISDTNLMDGEYADAGYTLGRTITCAVSVSEGTGYRTVSTHSDDFYAGLIVHTPVVNLVKGQTGAVRVQPTVPILCASTVVVDSDCSIPFAMFDPDPTYDCGPDIAVNNYEACGTSIPGDDFQTWTDRQDGTIDDGKRGDWDDEFSITVTTSNDNYQDKSTYTLALVLHQQDNTPIIWWNYPETTVTVLVTNNDKWERKQCYSHIDPHMMTFDQCPYENQEAGDREFILYEHEDYPMQVQVRHGNCWGVQCVCATTIQAGGDIFVADLCEGRHIVTFLSCKENIMDVRKINDVQYHVFLPTGTRVVIYIYGFFQNVDIYPSVKDFEKVGGLCGHFNDITCTDDFRLRQGGVTGDYGSFKDSWRIYADESLFNSANHNPGLWNKDFYLCACSADGITDGTTPAEVARCSPSEAHTCKRLPNLPGTVVTCTIIQAETNRRRRRRSARESVGLGTSRKELNRLYRNYGKADARINHHINKRQTTEASMTYDQAYAACEAFFQNSSNVMAVVNDLPVSNINNTLHDCALDISQTGDESLFWPHVTSFESNAKTELERDIDFTEEHGDVAYTVINETCLRACSGNGVCNNSVCTCNEGFGSSDCSVDLSIPPNFTDIYAGGFCDMKDDFCTECISLYGISILAGFVSRVKEIKHMKDGNISTSNSVDCGSEQISLFEGVVCVDSGCSMTYPKDDETLVVGYEIALSNDGEHFGTPLLYYEYDSLCQAYSNTTDEITFTLKENTCFIDGDCFIDGERNPDDSCYECSAEDDVWGWTSLKGEYGSADCSILLSDGPPLTNTSKGDVCDVTFDDSCFGCISVYGQNMLEGLVATVTEHELKVDGSIAFVAQRECAVQQVNLTEASLCLSSGCSIPTTSSQRNVSLGRRFEISVSNNGIDFGNEIPYTVYNSTCNEYTNMSVSLENDWCYIDGICYQNGAFKPDDDCFECDLDSTLWSWTSRKDEFGGEDCSIDLSVGPPVQNVSTNGFCDTSNSNSCPGCINVYGENYLDGLVSRISVSSISVDGTVMYHDTNDCQATALSLEQASVCLNTTCSPVVSEFVTSYEISVSNDGSNFGDSASYYVFDSACVSYSKDGDQAVFTVKNGTCSIDGKCYLDGQRKPSDGCYACSSERDQNGWTSLKDYYGSENCSIDLSIGPAINSIPSGNMCDIRQSDTCFDCLILTGNNFLEGMVFQVVAKQHLANGSVVLTDTSVCQVEHYNPTEALICLNTSCLDTKTVTDLTFVLGREFEISLSYDAVNFGSSVKYYVYDSLCQSAVTITNQLSFTMKANTCLIEGTCYAHEERDPQDGCNQCSATDDKYGWTSLEGEYGSADCSIDLSVGPPITNISRAGYCDVNLIEDCLDCIVLQGNNMLEGLQASVVAKQHQAHGSQVTIDTYVCTPSWASLTEASLCMKEHCNSQLTNISRAFVNEYQISLSNNGANFGSSMSYFIFDSRCQKNQEDSDGVFFSLMEDTCFIESNCISELDRKAGDNCSACVSDNNLWDWSSILDTHGGTDCSVDLSVGPTLSNTSVGSICDSSSGGCTECIVIQGENFFGDRNLFVKIENRQLLVNGDVISETTYMCAASVLSNTESEICPEKCSRLKRSTQQLAFVTQYIIAFSYDGINFGSTITYYVLDSTCQALDTSSSNLLLKNGTCFIDGNCYVSGSLNPTDTCEMCNPSSNMLAWTSVTSDECAARNNNEQELDESPTNIVVIIIPIVAVSVLIFIGVMVVIYKMKCKTERPVSPSIEDLRAHEKPVLYSNWTDPVEPFALPLPLHTDNSTFIYNKPPLSTRPSTAESRRPPSAQSAVSASELFLVNHNTSERKQNLE